MSQLAIFLLGASILLQIEVFAAEPVVKFIPPDSFSVGTIFVAGCTIENFVPANISDKEYTVNFNFLYAGKGVTKPTDFTLAFYTVTVGDPDSFVFIGMDQGNDKLGVSAAQGNVHLFPNFEVRLNPRSDTARSKYWCSLKVKEEHFSNEYKSNVWNGAFSAIPSAVFLAFCLAAVALKFQC